MPIFVSRAGAKSGPMQSEPNTETCPASDPFSTPNPHLQPGKTSKAEIKGDDMKKTVLSAMRLGLICLATASLNAQTTINDVTTDLGLSEFYAQTAWPAGHRDSRNSTS